VVGAHLFQYLYVCSIGFQETKKNKNGTAPHSVWRNYDDLNEYFWKVDCFQLGWPMREDGDFFKPPDLAGPKLAVSAVCIPLFFQRIWLFVSIHSRIDMAKLM
jgi:hypothetical protein